LTDPGAPGSVNTGFAIDSSRTLPGFRRTSIPDAALIEFDSVFSEQALEFVLE
jgi:hypothetical protein